MRLFEPVVRGKGILIDRAPSLPKHAVRKVDLDARCTYSTLTLEDSTTVGVERKGNNYTWSCIAPDGEIVFPDRITYSGQTNELTFHFLEPQSGVLTVAFLGD